MTSLSAGPRENFSEFRVVTGNDRHRNGFRRRDRTRDSEICVRPTPSLLRMDILVPHATTGDGEERPSRARMRTGKEPRRLLPVVFLAAAARATAVEALVAGAVANHDRAAVRTGRRVLLPLETDLDRAGFDGRGLCRRERSSRRGLNLDDRLSAHDADRLLLRPAEEF